MGKMGKMGNLGKYREKVTEKFPVGSLSQRVGNPLDCVVGFDKSGSLPVGKMDEEENNQFDRCRDDSIMMSLSL